MIKSDGMKNALTGFSMDDVFLLLHLQPRTGELVLESGNNIGSILLHEGRILQAFSPYSRAIGDLLVEDGLVTEAELIDTLKLQKKDPYLPLGGLLLKQGKVGFEVIQMMVHEQIREAVKEFRSWSDLSFNFIEKEITPFDAINLPLHEFIKTDILKTAVKSLDSITRRTDQSASTQDQSTTTADSAA